MKSMRYVFILVLVMIVIGVTGCSDTSGNEQITSLTNEVSGLRNSLNSTQQELASTKQSLQQLQQSAAAPTVQSSAPQTIVTNQTDVPVIVNFSITPTSVIGGSKAVLQWYVTGAATVSINQGIGVVSSSGSRAVYPGATTTYVITASNCCSSVTSSATVTVSGYSYSNCCNPSPCYYLAYPYAPVIRYVVPVPRPAPVPPYPYPYPYPRPYPCP